MPRRARTAELLEYVGLAHRAHHRPSQLSGGEMQRVAIARALANRPVLLLADEPTGELDHATGEQIAELFDRVQQDGTAIVVVTHDQAMASRAGRTLVMRDGRIEREEVDCMILRLALRSLLTHPVRTLVLACGFGLGVGVMAMLLGVGEVILDQARSPAVSGGGDVVIASSTGELPSARWILSSGLRAGGFESRVSAASPSRRATLYLVKNPTTTAAQRWVRLQADFVLPIRVQAGIPSLERAIGDPETSLVTSWTDAVSDAPWSSPDPGAALAALDRFHPIPDVPARAESWAEWLYFNGHAGDNRFYLTFLVGPKRAGGKRIAGVRLQLDRAGQRSSYSQTQEVNEADVLSSAPNLTIGSNRVRLDGMRYRHHARSSGRRPDGRTRHWRHLY